MDELGKNLEKLVKAGIGAVSEGLSRTQDLVDKLAEKGEPLYNQARAGINETADIFCKAVKETMEDDDITDEIKHALAQLDREQLEEVSAFLNELMEITRPGEETCCGGETESGPEEEETVPGEDPNEKNTGEEASCPGNDDPSNG